MTLALLGILVPVAGALVAFAWRSERSRPLWLPVVAAVHLAVTICAVVTYPQPSAGRWLMLDPPGRLVLLLVSTVCRGFVYGYLRRGPERPNRIFCACLMLFLE